MPVFRAGGVVFVVPGSGFDVERYSIALRPDLATGRVSAEQAITLRATRDGVCSLAFSPNALEVGSPNSGKEPVAVVSRPDAIVFILDRELERGQRTTLRFSLIGKPSRGLTKVPGGIFTGYFACDWMVCLQDAPGDKADLALNLYLPDGLTSLGVGRAVTVVTLANGVTRHSWRSTRAVSPYLYAFAAGSFARAGVSSREGQFDYWNGSGAHADLDERFADTPAIAAFFAGKAGLPLPDHHYAQLLVPGFEAQETASFSLIGSDELEREREEPGSAWIVAHELAHQWWGNLVTCASWQDFWLNEGFATFMTAAWKQQSLGETAYQQELEIARTRLGRAREQGFDKPLAWAGKYPSLGMRRAVQYSKGALFLAHLRHELGDKVFRHGVRSYTRRHAGRAVTSKDLQRAMEDASGRDLSRMFDLWVYG